jgi:sulfur-carrier protein
VSLTVHLPLYLRSFAEGRDRVVLEGELATVADALAALGARHPGVRDRVVTESGELRPHVHVFVGSESIRHTGGFATSLRGAREIFILPAVSGG